MNLSPIIKRIWFTEKSASKEAKKVYTVIANAKANKIDIAKAFAKNYGVKVAKVNIVNLPKKLKTNPRGGQRIKRPALKKALIYLERGEKNIDFVKFSAK